MYQKEKLRAQLGASLRPTNTHNETNGESYDSKVLNWSPEAMLSYDIDDNTMVRMFYFGRSSQPSTSQLMPVPDNSDPLNVSLGNPYLLPYFNHNIRGMFGYTNRETFTSIHGRVGGSLVQDGIVNAQWYDENGAQYSMPVNGPVSGSADANLMINSPFGRNSKFSMSSMTFARYSESSSYIGKSGTFNTDDYYDSENAEFDYEAFMKMFNADSDAIITKGIISLLIRIYSGRTAPEILSSDFSVVDRIGLKENLSPTRANGLVSMISKIREIAAEIEGAD